MPWGLVFIGIKQMLLKQPFKANDHVSRWPRASRLAGSHFGYRRLAAVDGFANFDLCKACIEQP